MGGKPVTWWAQWNPGRIRRWGKLSRGRLPVTTPSEFCGTPPMQRWPSGSQGADPRSVPWRQPHQQSGSVGSLTTAVVGLGGAAQLVGKESRTQSMRLVAATKGLVVPQWLIVFPSKRGAVKPSRDHPLTFRRFSRSPSRCKFWARPQPERFCGGTETTGWGGWVTLISSAARSQS